MSERSRESFLRFSSTCSCILDPCTMNRSEILAFHTLSLRESAAVALAAIDACAEPLADAIEAVVATYRRGGKVLFCGNGGSAADCQHLATELMVRLSHDIDRPALGA